MEIEFCKQLLKIKQDRETSARQLAKECDICYLSFVRFFNPKAKLQPIRDITMSRLHNRLGISYEVMQEYNREVEKRRKGE